MAAIEPTGDDGGNKLQNPLAKGALSSHGYHPKAGQLTNWEPGEQK